MHVPIQRPRTVSVLGALLLALIGLTIHPAWSSAETNSLTNWKFSTNPASGLYSAQEDVTFSTVFTPGSGTDETVSISPDVLFASSTYGYAVCTQIQTGGALWPATVSIASGACKKVSTWGPGSPAQVWTHTSSFAASSYSWTVYASTAKCLNLTCTTLASVSSSGSSRQSTKYFDYMRYIRPTYYFRLYETSGTYSSAGTASLSLTRTALTALTSPGLFQSGYASDGGITLQGATSKAAASNASSNVTDTAGHTFEGLVLPGNMTGTDIVVEGNRDVYVSSTCDAFSMCQLEYKLGTTSLTTGYIYPAGVALWFAATWNGSTASLYVNGSQVATSAVSGTVLYYRSGYPLLKLASTSAATNTDSVDDISVWYAGRSASAIASDYAASVPA